MITSNGNVTLTEAAWLEIVADDKERTQAYEDRIRALEAELAERTAQRDAVGNEGMRLAAELAKINGDYGELLYKSTKTQDDRIRALEAALLRAQKALTGTPAEVWVSLKTAIDEVLATSETPSHLRGPIIQAHADTNGVPPVETKGDAG